MVHKIKYSIPAVKKYVAERMAKYPPYDNITIGLPGLTDADIQELRGAWDVQRGAFGYVEFRKKETGQ